MDITTVSVLNDDLFKNTLATTNLRDNKTVMECRICKSRELRAVIDIGSQVNTSRFPKYGDFSLKPTPICLVMCKDCNLVQLRDTVEQSELYEHNYGYRSGISNTMRQHLSEYNAKLCCLIELNEREHGGSCVLDVGSNDSTFLSCYPNFLRRVGIDPTGKQFQSFYKDVELAPTYFTKQNVIDAFGDKIRFKIVTSISMFYDLPDPVQFARDVFDLLEDDGIWSLEQSYILTMLKRNSVDTICHEHIEYYSVKQIKRIMDESGFKIVDIAENECNGGSFRITAAKKGSTRFSECVTIIDGYLRSEVEYGLSDENCYKTFMERVDSEINKLKSFIDTVNKNGKKIYIYGASTKGNCLLQYAGIGEDKIKYAVERNLNKVGMMTSTGIEIISEETMRANPPAYLLVLPWHFKDEIIQREDAFLEGGGQLVFPFPNFSLHSKKPRMLITGIHGQIGSYLYEQACKTHAVYGISKRVMPIGSASSLDIDDCSALIFDVDMTDMAEMERTITAINPSEIAHLAGNSMTDYCMQHPVETSKINGVSTVMICDIIHRNKMETKLFNASSSELFKGHSMYVVNEDDSKFAPTHPYSFSKLLGHLTVNYYREKYNLPFSNGVIFTNESSRRKPYFLFKKVALHAKKWSENLTTEHLDIGSLEGYRAILHSSDVASGIIAILKQPTGQNYNICSNNMYKLYDIIHLIYEGAGIGIVKRQNEWFCKETGRLVLKIGDNFRETPCSIQGKCIRLYDLHWIPRFTIGEICSEIVSNTTLGTSLEETSRSN